MSSHTTDLAVYVKIFFASYENKWVTTVIFLSRYTLPYSLFNPHYDGQLK